MNVEEEIAVREKLQQKVTRLNQAIQSIQKREITSKGKSLVLEYQLRIELEGLRDDILFLRDKRDRLVATLVDLKAKNESLIHSSNNEFEKRQSTGVSDASVQTEDWPIGYTSEWPDPP